MMIGLLSAKLVVGIVVGPVDPVTVQDLRRSAFVCNALFLCICCYVLCLCIVCFCLHICC